MTWSELEALIREKMREQPRGFQTRLAERLGVTQPTVAQMLMGRRGFPAEHVPVILDALGLKLAVVSKDAP